VVQCSCDCCLRKFFVSLFLESDHDLNYPSHLHIILTICIILNCALVNPADLNIISAHLCLRNLTFSFNHAMEAKKYSLLISSCSYLSKKKSTKTFFKGLVPISSKTGIGIFFRRVFLRGLSQYKGIHNGRAILIAYPHPLCREDKLEKFSLKKTAFNFCKGSWNRYNFCFRQNRRLVLI